MLRQVEIYPTEKIRPCIEVPSNLFRIFKTLIGLYFET